MLERNCSASVVIVREHVVRAYEIWVNFRSHLWAIRIYNLGFSVSLSVWLFKVRTSTYLLLLCVLSSLVYFRQLPHLLDCSTIIASESLLVPTHFINQYLHHYFHFFNIFLWTKMSYPPINNVISSTAQWTGET